MYLSSVLRAPNIQWKSTRLTFGSYQWNRIYLVVNLAHSFYIATIVHPWFDNGSEYKNIFNEMCNHDRLTKKPSTPYYPQSNGIIERVHQVLNDSLRTFELEERE